MHPWRERLARWFTPLARRCPLSPNAITAIALAINLIAAACMYFGERQPALFALSIVFLTVGGLADAFDGIVARVQQKSSRFGDFLDHVADRISDTVVVAAWMLGSGVRPSLTVFGTILVMLNGYIGTQIEATFGERSYEGVGRGEFVLALIVYPITSYILFTHGWNRTAILSVTEWMTVALIVSALLGIMQRMRLAARLG